MMAEMRMAMMMMMTLADNTVESIILVQDSARSVQKTSSSYLNTLNEAALCFSECFMTAGL